MARQWCHPRCVCLTSMSLRTPKPGSGAEQQPHAKRTTLKDAARSCKASGKGSRGEAPQSDTARITQGGFPLEFGNRTHKSLLDRRRRRFLRSLMQAEIPPPAIHGQGRAPVVVLNRRDFSPSRLARTKMLNVETLHIIILR